MAIHSAANITAPSFRYLIETVRHKRHLVCKKYIKDWGQLGTVANFQIQRSAKRLFLGCVTHL